MSRRSTRFHPGLNCLLAMLIAGCQPPAPPGNPLVAPVHGVVTLNGRPLVQAEVMFESLQSRPSYGITNDSGHYELTYDQFSQGAFLGSHVVRITPFSRPLQGIYGQPIPARYNTKSELKVQVQRGDNLFDFHLTDEDAESSQAPRSRSVVVQPTPLPADTSAPQNVE